MSTATPPPDALPNPPVDSAAGPVPDPIAGPAAPSVADPPPPTVAAAPAGYPAAPSVADPPPPILAHHPATPPPPGPAPHRRSTHTEPPKSRPRTALWIWTGAVSVVVLLVAVVVVLQVSASGAYDSARTGYDKAVSDTASAQDGLGSEASAEADAVTTAQSIVQSAPDGLVDTTARDAVSAAASALSDEVGTAQGLAAADAPAAPTGKPVVFWDLLSAVGVLNADTATLDDRQSALSAAGSDLDADAVALDDSANTLYASAGTAGPAFESAHIDARNAEVIAFRDATDALTGEYGVTADAAGAMTAYATAASAVVSSEQEELASIAGPLFDARMAVQQFARSIDGGVLVEFDWAPTVNGFGEGGSVSGYTTWNYDHGGHAVILLSDSVAELWPSDVSHNLVAHEVGHAISSKCPTLYDDQDQASIEAFATAWAISMGYTGDGNGVSIYGQPSDALIASAATCR